MMLHRKKHSGNEDSPLTAVFNDDGGSAKAKPPHLSFIPMIRTAFGSALAFSKNLISGPACCLSGIPAAFKLILLSFLGFAILVVFTAKGRHEHWRYQHGMRAPHMPIPLMESIHRNIGRLKGRTKKQFHETSVNFPHRQSQILVQSSRFVDSEKKLKQQLKELFEMQHAEKKHNSDNPENSILGVKVSNRYLGDDLLPYPKSKGVEQEWEREMEMRKAELTKFDEEEWNEILTQYNKVTENYVNDEGGADHISEPWGRSDNESVDYGLINGESMSLHPHHSDRWPSPSEKAGPNTTILLKPTFGFHRPSQDVIFAFAEGYDLSVYLAFVESLTKTGYKGDLVFSISSEENLKPGVKEYLLSKKSEMSDVNIVAYEVNWTCFKQSGEPAAGSGEGMNHCKMNGVFGDVSGNPVLDPRDPRPVATARYEVYWIWSLQYNKESWIMLIDARDVWFQLHPFEELSRRGKISGELHLFGVRFYIIMICF